MIYDRNCIEYIYIYMLIQNSKPITLNIYSLGFNAIRTHKYTHTISVNRGFILFELFIMNFNIHSVVIDQWLQVSSVSL